FLVLEQPVELMWRILWLSLLQMKTRGLNGKEKCR
ncbi:MAG: hypothetical protein ACJAUP_000074, partial [Cellvibrionaceae bacterium]